MKMNQKSAKRILSLLMVVMMLTAIIPAAVSAAEIPADATVVYLDGTVAESGDGTTAATAVKTLVEAYEYLDANKTMEKNIVLVCNDTEIDLSANHLTMAAKAATIRSIEGKTVTLTATDTGSGTSIYNKLIFKADTHFDNVNLAFSTHNIMNTANKLILNVTGVASGAEGCDMEIYGGQYANVGVMAMDGAGSVVIHGGKVTARLEASANMDNLTMTVLGGSIANMLPTGRNNDKLIGNFVVTLGGATTVNSISTKNFDTNITDSTVLYASFTGNVGGTFPTFKKVGVAAGGTDADIAVAIEKAAAAGLDTVYVQGEVTLADGNTLAEVTGVTKLAGIGANAALKLTDKEHTVSKDLSFQDITLACAGTEEEPTVIWYEGDVDALKVTGSYLMNTNEKPHTHVPESDDGDCTTAVKCADCDEVLTPAAASHTGGAATCTARAKCETCGTEYGELAAHTGGTAACTAKAKCETCGAEYGELAQHSFTVSKSDATHHWNQCSSCDAIDAKAEHSFGNDDVCDSCQYERAHVCGNAALTAGKAATCTEPGVKDSYTCSCGKQYYDAACTELVANEADLAIAQLEHRDEDKDGLCDSCQAEVGAPAGSGNGTVVIIVIVVLVVAAAAVAVVVIKKKK